MKKPDEIKKGLWVCNSIGRAVKGESWCKENCPYMDETFGCGNDYMLEDALAYIEQLEADNARLNRCIENMTDKLIATNDALPCWISVKEKKPPKHMGEYLCWCALDDDTEHKWDWAMVLRWHAIEGNGIVDRPHFTDEGVNGMYVTHWMPLPEPPKEE